jgi:hypothetical protein
MKSLISILSEPGTPPSSLMRLDHSCSDMPGYRSRGVAELRVRSTAAGLGINSPMSAHNYWPRTGPTRAVSFTTCGMS